MSHPALRQSKPMMPTSDPLAFAVLYPLHVEAISGAIGRRRVNYFFNGVAGHFHHQKKAFVPCTRFFAGTASNSGVQRDRWRLVRLYVN